MRGRLGSLSIVLASALGLLTILIPVLAGPVPLGLGGSRVTVEQERRFAAHEGTVTDIGFSPDGQVLGTASASEGFLFRNTDVTPVEVDPAAQVFEFGLTARQLFVSVMANIRMVIAADDQMGLGTQDPQALLHLQDLYPAGGRNLQIGDDTFLSDVDVGNRLGLFGVQDPQVASLQLGSQGPVVSGRDDKLGVGIDSPSEALEVAGNLRLSGTGSVSKIVSPHDICIGNC